MPVPGVTIPPDTNSTVNVPATTQYALAITAPFNAGAAPTGAYTTTSLGTKLLTGDVINNGTLAVVTVGTRYMLTSDDAFALPFDAVDVPAALPTTGFKKLEEIWTEIDRPYAHGYKNLSDEDLAILAYLVTR